MKNILIVFTGGTIGSSVKNKTIDTGSENQFELLALFNQCYSKAADINFTTISPVNMLSENLVPAVWERLITAIEAVDKQTIDGIIVTHGTDTLAFSACALGLFYRQITLPLVLVSSDYPLADSRANGLDNFIAAIEFIVQRSEAGVFVAYRNQQQTMQIHLGHRIASCLQLSSDFTSVQSKPYLEFVDHRFNTLNNRDKFSETKLDGGNIKPLFSKRVLLIKPYPGLNYTQINLHNIDAVLHDLYHSGTACVSDEWGKEYSLVHFMRRCREAKVNVYLAPAVFNSDIYASTKVLLDEGGIFVWNMSLEAAYAALLLGYGNFDDAKERERYLQTCWTIE